MMRITALIVSAAVASVLAQQPRDGQRPAPRTGSGVLTGVVLTSDAPAKPLRRALVTLKNPALPIGLAGITDDQGRFRIEQVPAGRYTVEVAKAAYLTTAYGARRPGRAGMAIVFADGQQHDLTIHLQRGSVLAGRITDVSGQPVPGAMVEVFRHGYQGTTGDRVLQPQGGTAIVDDAGNYRVFGLPPGEYVVGARAPSMAQGNLQVLSASEVRQALAAVRESRQDTSRVPGLSSPPAALPVPTGPVRNVTLAPVFYPGVNSSADAWTIGLGPGEEKHSLDFQVYAVPTATVSGLVIGQHAHATQVTLRRHHVAAAAPTPDRVVRNTALDGDGRFNFTNVPPGLYEITARSAIMFRREGAFVGLSTFWGTTTIVVDGEDVETSLAMQPGFDLSGQLVFDGARPPSPELLAKAQIRLPLQPQPATGGQILEPPLELHADGRFTAHGLVPGVYRPLVTSVPGIRGPAGGWWLQSIVLGGREMLDAPLSLHRGSEEAVVTFADRASELSGSVTDAGGSPISDKFLIVFSANPTHWFPTSRRVSALTLPPNGRYSVHNLPPGEYLIVVDDDVDPGEWYDPSYLGRVAGRAQRITIGAFERAFRDIVVSDR